MAPSGSNDNFIDARSELKAAEILIARGHRKRLEAIVALDSPEIWESDGHRTFAQWLSAQLGVSNWLAGRLINTAHSLPLLPEVDRAFRDARLSLEKVVELTRFARPENEDRLVKWAERVSPAAVRRKADVENRKEIADAIDPDRDRWVRYWWFDEGRRFGLEGEFPADQGAAIAKALDRIADAVPDVIDDEQSVVPREESVAERRADAVYSMASRQIAQDQDPDRATVVVHAELGALAGDGRGCEIERGPVIHAETARRMSCDGRIQFVLHNDLGDVVGIGRVDRNPPPWLRRQVRKRDGGCSFHGCGSTRFLHNHHIDHWTNGGSTDLDNLTLVCTFHHKLLHEYGWSVKLGPPGITHWYRPDGTEYLPNRAPPQLAHTG